MIQFEEARTRVDPKFIQLAKEFSDAYYTYWRNGVSYVWHDFDLLSKDEFDIVHGALWHIYDLALIHEIERSNFGYSRDRYDPVLDKTTGKRRSEIAKDKLAEFLLNNPSMHSKLTTITNIKY